MGLWRRLREITGAYLANDDPFARISNTGAFIVWSNQPFYPIYVWALVGADAWPALLTWLSTPFFFAVPFVARRSSLLGRAFFVLAGLGNTLVSLKAFGPHVAIGWFLVPCLIIAATFFRPREWHVSGPLVILSLLAVAAIGHLGLPLHDYAGAQATSLSHLNMWSAGVLSLYLAYAAISVRRQPTV